MTVTFACGHRQPIARDIKDVPVCAQCGEHRIRMVDAPKPRITVRTA